MLTKNQLIDSIQEINSSARADWLAMFDISALHTYLNNLQRTLEPRGADSRWLRTQGTSPFIMRQARF